MAASASSAPELATVAGVHSTLLQPGAPLTMSCGPQRDLQGCKQPAPICWVQAAVQLWVTHLAAGSLCQQPVFTGHGMVTMQVVSLQHLMRCISCAAAWWTRGTKPLLCACDMALQKGVALH